MAGNAGAATGRPIVLVAAAALVDRDSRVLLAQRPEGKPMAGLWSFPAASWRPARRPRRR